MYSLNHLDALLRCDLLFLIPNLLSFFCITFTPISLEQDWRFFVINIFSGKPSKHPFSFLIEDHFVIFLSKNTSEVKLKLLKLKKEALLPAASKEFTNHVSTR